MKRMFTQVFGMCFSNMMTSAVSSTSMNARDRDLLDADISGGLLLKINSRQRYNSFCSATYTYFTTSGGMILSGAYSHKLNVIIDLCESDDQNITEYSDRNQTLDGIPDWRSTFQSAFDFNNSALPANVEIAAKSKVLNTL